jgi:2'-5' RNA ligase
MAHRSWPGHTRVGDHTAWRPEWTSCRPLLWWYLTFGNHPEVAAHAARAAAALGPLPHVDVPPPEWLHLTLCEVGFRDEVDDERVQDGVWAVSEALRAAAPVDLRLGPVNSLHDAVVLEARPLDGLRGLRATVRGAMARGGVAPAQVDEGHFWPHVTVGYLNAVTDHAGLMEAVGRPASEVTTATADRLELVEVTRADRHYRWRTRAMVALGDAAVRRN